MNDGNQKTGKGSRPRSEVGAPYYDLDSAVEVATKIHEHGGAVTRDQLAPILGYSGTKNGGFLSRLGAARMFGLVEEVGGVLRPSQLAVQVYAPVHAADAQRAKVQAFLNVELFERIYERFKGQPLPSATGLENLLRNEFKVVPARIKPALRTFEQSAESAGFFDAAGKGRLVLPLAANTKSAAPTVASPVNEAPPPAAPSRASYIEDSAIPPAIFGLIRDLPSEGSAMSKAKRDRLIKAFEASINWLYPDSEEAANE